MLSQQPRPQPRIIFSLQRIIKESDIVLVYFPEYGNHKKNCALELVCRYLENFDQQWLRSQNGLLISSLGRKDYLVLDRLLNIHSSHIAKCAKVKREPDFDISEIDSKDTNILLSKDFTDLSNYVVEKSSLKHIYRDTDMKQQLQKISNILLEHYIGTSNITHKQSLSTYCSLNNKQSLLISDINDKQSFLTPIIARLLFAINGYCSIERTTKNQQIAKNIIDAIIIDSNNNQRKMIVTLPGIHMCNFKLGSGSNKTEIKSVHHHLRNIANSQENKHFYNRNIRVSVIFCRQASTEGIELLYSLSAKQNALYNDINKIIREERTRIDRYDLSGKFDVDTCRPNIYVAEIDDPISDAHENDTKDHTYKDLYSMPYRNGVCEAVEKIIKKYGGQVEGKDREYILPVIYEELKELLTKIRDEMLVSGYVRETTATDRFHLNVPDGITRMINDSYNNNLYKNKGKK